MLNLRVLFPAFIMLLIFFSMAVGIYTDYLWFIELGYVSVFLEILSTKLLLLAGVAIFFFAVIFLNIKISERTLHKNFSFVLPGIILVAIIAGILSMDSWETVLRYLNQAEFNVLDPIFNLNAGFYIFTLPFYFFLWNIAFYSFFVSTIFVSILYLIPFFTELMRKHEDEFRPVKVSLFKNKKSVSHLLIVGGVLLLLIGTSLFLQRYSILNSTLGVVNGAGFTDVNIVLPYITVMATISAILGIVFFISAFKRIRIIRLGIISIIAAALIGGVAVALVQSYVVVPDEFNHEKEFIEHDIKFTRQAYGLEEVKETEFPALQTLTADSIEENKQTIDNIRLWDWRPILRTYKQLQLIRTYYDFNDADVDRYTLNGNYRQVMISAREVNSNLLPDKSWVNQHLVFTHGYGATVSPVSEVSPEGLPQLYVQDIPPKSELLEITRPELYFGELTGDYVIVRTNTEELDFPKGEINVYTTYEGNAGVPLNAFDRFIMALNFRSAEILFSNSITSESRIIFNQDIEQRVSKLAPFLVLDNDPYIVVDDGRLFWIVDAYTISDRYPYSQKLNGAINYIRNPVKAVVDAYNGDVTFYVIGEEPIIETYRKIFPELFVDFSEMPEGLKSHVRYPVDLFNIQAEIYQTYHMRDPRVFYNKEDVWERPSELYERERIRMEPYYLIMQLPGEERGEFVLLQPFTPTGKNNIIGWMAARNDFPNYGERIVFMFPKEKLVFGPMQIEARIDQNPEISQRFTLWDQIGTRVIRGNLLVIPIEDSLLYIEPIYLRAEQEGALPELKRVIVSYGNKVTMQETLEESLAVIFGGKVEVEEEFEPIEAELRDTKDLIVQALQHYTRAQELLKAGDWTGYGNELEELRKILEELNRR